MMDILQSKKKAKMLKKKQKKTAWFQIPRFEDLLLFDFYL